tara:strand:+ start:17514 stop:18143 length:630 start_codon:yes stop_codon:yes gene_type:complete
MAKVIVGNPKGFALTQNKVYDVIEREGRKITIVNDNNITTSYYASVFKNEGKEVVKAAPKVPTVDEIIETVVIDLGQGAITFSISGAQFVVNNTLGNAGTNISCGIRQIFGINTFYDVFTEFLENEAAQLPAALRAQLVDALFKESVERLMQNVETQVGLFTASTNTNYNEFTRIDNVLTPMTVANHTRINPNSGNEIKLWVLDQQYGD